MDILEIIGLATFLVGCVAFICIIRPSKTLGMPTRKFAALIWLICFVTTGICATHSSTWKSDDAVAAAAPSATQPVQVAEVVAMPTDETAFIDAINKGRDGFHAAANEMAQGGVRAKRKGWICAILGPTKGIVKDWTGEVATLSSNEDGKGVLGLTIADDVTVTTTNNDFSDSEFKTLIDPSSDLFQAASALKVGEKVIFSGRFFRSDADCVNEQSLTLEGSITDPAFTFRFTSVRSAE